MLQEKEFRAPGEAHRLQSSSRARSSSGTVNPVDEGSPHSPHNCDGTRAVKPAFIIHLSIKSRAIPPTSARGLLLRNRFSKPDARTGPGKIEPGIRNSSRSCITAVRASTHRRAAGARIMQWLRSRSQSRYVLCAKSVEG